MNSTDVSPKATTGTAPDRLRTHLEGLSRQQRRVAEYLLDNEHDIPFLSVQELAERTGASEATVVRLCQAIGYRGFPDLKMAMVERLRSYPPAREVATDIDRESLELVARHDRLNLERTLEQIDRREFRAVADALFDADHIFTWGLGVSAHLAGLAAYLFTEHGLRSHPLDHRFSNPREQLVTLRDQDLVLVFSFPPYSRQTLELLDACRERGALTVAITDRPSAPAAVAADHALAAASSGVMLGNSMTATTLVLNALLLEIAFTHQGETAEALSRINQLLSGPDHLAEEG
jgi:DNA-binding MurR/RpiR family transcriptional regulator